MQNETKFRWTQKEEAEIVSIMEKEECDRSTAIRRMRARQKAADKATVNNVTLTAEERKRRETEAQRAAAIKQADDHNAIIVKELGELRTLVEAADEARNKVVIKLSDLVKASSAFREALQGMRDYFAAKPSGEIYKGINGEYKVATEWAKGEIGTTYYYVCKCLNNWRQSVESASELKTIGGSLRLTEKSEGTSKGSSEDSVEAEARQAKAIESAVNKVLANADNLSAESRKALEDTFKAPSHLKEVHEVPEGENKSEEVLDKSEVSVRETALKVDVYGGKADYRFNFGLLDDSLAVEIIAKLLDKVIDKSDDCTLILQTLRNNVNARLSEADDALGQSLVLTVNPTEGEAIPS